MKPYCFPYFVFALGSVVVGEFAVPGVYKATFEHV